MPLFTPPGPPRRGPGGTRARRRPPENVLPGVAPVAAVIARTGGGLRGRGAGGRP